ncbi:ComEA family DNA-binding protein [Paenibacillus sp. SI8]|uniref:ComEA family DNA-binding protein n=1 Tax=unclassified Paenibacillus TaxID=185978 RepID=UPI0034651FF2
MDFFGKRRSFIVLSALTVGLFGYVIWQFAFGGRSRNSNDFLPVNEQMQKLIAQSAEKNHVSSKKEPEYELDLTKKGAAHNTETVSPTVKATATPTSTDMPIKNSAIETPLSTESESKISSSNFESPSDKRLNLNTATLEQLDRLPGIGASKAKAIIDFRSQKGRFERIEQLAEVKGIGEKMLEKLKPLVYIAQPQ